MAAFLHYRPVCGRVGRCARWAGVVKRFPLFAALAALAVSLFAAALALAVREVVLDDGLARRFDPLSLGGEDWCEVEADGPSLPVRVPLGESPVPKLRAVPARDSGSPRGRGGPELRAKRVRRSSKNPIGDLGDI